MCSDSLKSLGDGISCCQIYKSQYRIKNTDAGSKWVPLPTWRSEVILRMSEVSGEGKGQQMPGQAECEGPSCGPQDPSEGRFPWKPRAVTGDERGTGHGHSQSTANPQP
jgi:hypothetical protein